MKKFLILSSILVVLCSCKKPEPDSKGMLPQKVALQAHKLMQEGKYEDAKKFYSKSYIEEQTSSKYSFEKHLKESIKEFQKSEFVEGSASPSKNSSRIWIVEVKVKGGKPVDAIVLNMALLNGEWKIVTWKEIEG